MLGYNGSGIMDQEHTPEKPKIIITIGDSLSKARKKAGLTVEDVASDLLLKPELIRSIEANELEGLSAPAYVKGYIRSYARILGLDPTDMIEEYDSLGYDQPGWVMSVDQQQKPESVLRLLSLAIPVGLVLVGLFIAWLLTSGYLNPPVEEDYLQSEAIDSTGESVTAAVTTISNELPQPGDTPSLELSEPQPLVSVTDQALATEDITPLVPGVIPQATGVNTESAMVSTQSQETEAMSSATEVTNSATEDGSTSVSLAETDFIRADSGSDEVIVILTEESWVEIDDASKQQLLNGLYKAGDVKILTGQAPFQVFLGNANGVELTINGLDYDVKARKRQNNTARFALINQF